MSLLTNIYKAILLQLFLLGNQINVSKADDKDLFTDSLSDTTNNGTNSPPTYHEILERRRVNAEMLYSRISAQMHNMSFHSSPLGSQVMPVELYSHIIYILETEVQVLVRIERIDHMDVMSETLMFTSYVGFVWQDDNLQWDPKSGVYQLILDPTRIWTPPVIASGVINYVLLNDYNQVVVDYKGLASQVLNVKYTVPCEVSVLDFPFDKHKCQVKISQLYNGGMRMKFKEKVDWDLRRTTGDTFVFNQKGAHAEWELIDWNNSVYYESNQLTHTYQLTVVLQRRALFHAVVLLLPCVILNILSLVVFIIPADTAARVDITLSLIVAYFVLLMILVDTMPPSGSRMPIFGFYLCSSVSILAIGLLFSALLVKFHTWQSLGRKVPCVLKCCLTSAERYYGNTTKSVIRKPVESGKQLCEGHRCHLIDAKDFSQKLYTFPISESDMNQQRSSLKAKGNDRVGGDCGSCKMPESIKWDIIIRNFNRASFVIVLVLHVILIIFISLFWFL